jgi:hypothetical protein
MSEKRTFVDEDRYLFTTEVERKGFPQFVTVQWTGVRFTPTEAFLRPLRAYLRPRLEVSEVWLVFPADLLSLFQALCESDRLWHAERDNVPREYRFFAVGLDGGFREHHLLGDQALEPVSKVTASEVVADGLRQLFRDTDSLATAAAGYHFAHPSGSHSEYFIRTSQSVSRLHHSYFVAMALLPVIHVTPSDFTIWLDTASISSLGYAYADLLRRGGLEGLRRVETFGGYRGLELGLRPSRDDIVLISGSTSCTLARTTMADKKVAQDSVVTLFYLGARSPVEDDGLVLCDLTNRHENAHPSVREARVPPYETFKAHNCAICALGSGEIRLEGDSFFPAASELDLRMPSFADRPLNGKTGARSKNEIVEFDGSDYFRDLFGLDAIAFDPGTEVDSSVYGVSTRLGHLVDGPLEDKIIAAAHATLAGANPVAAVVSLLDGDSTALGGLLAKRLLGPMHTTNLTESDVTRREWRRSGGASLSSISEGGTILVCAAVVGSGRKLTDVARELRKVPGRFDIRYLVGAAHPESSTTWAMLTQTLKRVSTDETSELHQIWRLPREPRFPDAKSPWTRELGTLAKIGKWLGEQPKFASLASALEPRLKQLHKLSSETLFVGAVNEIARVNRNFALWPFDWSEHESGETPNHAEIYATTAHLLYESRRRSPRLDSRNLTARRHGYALHPAVFDRFNDPVIQAAILRAAEPGELHYTTDRDASRAVADLLWFVLSNVGSEAGDAAYEFLLALCEGCDHEDAPGMRIDFRSANTLLDQLEEDRHEGPDFFRMETKSPRIRALLLYYRGQNRAVSA